MEMERAVEILKYFDVSFLWNGGNQINYTLDGNEKLKKLTKKYCNGGQFCWLQMEKAMITDKIQKHEEQIKLLKKINKCL